uniref:Sulfotransferase n=1 Tax=Populus alba TaxID=43335 RepID=A0A4U5NNW4_POPAL|nr:hypothetical protein D5086_0000249050 [Populus alba]
MESSLPSTQILDSGESAERKNEAKNYSEVMSTLPKVKGWRGYDYYLYQGFCSPKTGTTWLKALTFAILTRSRLSGSTTSSLLTKMHMTVFHFWNLTLLKTQGRKGRFCFFVVLSFRASKGRKMLNLFLWKRLLSCSAMELQIFGPYWDMF